MTTEFKIFMYHYFQVLFSGKMLESKNYLASVEKGELVPQLTLNEFVDKEHDWNILEEGQIMAGVSLTETL